VSDVIVGSCTADAEAETAARSVVEQYLATSGPQPVVPYELHAISPYGMKSGKSDEKADLPNGPSEKRQQWF
jgi:hypothetical protein